MAATTRVTRVTFRNKGFRELLTHPNIQADLRRRAERVAGVAGEGYVAASSGAQLGSQDSQGRWRDTSGRFVTSTGLRRRARSAVIAVSYRARRDNSANNTLVRSLDAGR